MVDINTMVIKQTDNLTYLPNLTNLTDKVHDDYVSSMNTEIWGHSLKTMVPLARNSLY